MEPLPEPTSSTNQTTSPTKKTWLRWCQIHGSFREDKYHFTKHLKKVGDYVITKPMTQADYIRIKDAAKTWAYRKNKRISTRKIILPDNMCKVKVTLVSQHRMREYSL